MNFKQEDFENPLRIFEYLYQVKKENEFKHLEEKEKLSKQAKTFDILAFKKQYELYCKQQKNANSSYYEDNITEFTGLDFQLVCGNWECTDEGIYQKVQMGFLNTELEACNHPILPIERLTNVDTNIEKVKLIYKRRKKWREIVVNKKTISSNNLILDLADYGVSVTSETAKNLVKFLKDIDYLNYEEIDESKSISRMGWIDDYGFVPYNEDLIFDGEANYRTIYESVHTKGKFDKWLDLAREVRQKGITARIILIASFASVLIKKVKGLPFFVHLWGGTEVGKTVGLMLATSVWANPEEAVYMQSLKNTDVFLEKLAAFVNNMPLILDELQLIKEKKNFDNMIYSLTEGIGKGRGTKTGGIEKSGTWKNCILTSGEDPILNSASGGGAANRILEIECKEKLFDNPRQAASIVQSNYGFAGKKFVEWLEVEENVEKAKELFHKYIHEIEKENTTSKQAMSMAILLATDEIVTEIIFKDGKNLKINEVKEFLKSKDEISIELRAYNYIYETIVANANKFNETENMEVWGTQDNKFFYIISNRFNKICLDGNFNPKTILSWMKSKGKIECGSKGNAQSKRVGGNSIPCIYMKKNNFESAEMAQDELPF